MAVAHPLLSGAGGDARAAAEADESDDAYAAAYRDLIGALARAFRALAQPECARLLGPVVPGATMTQGARIPGTSYELDPVAAAFCIGTMIGWAGERDAADSFGAILAVGDYLARKAHNEGERPPAVRDLLRSMIEARAVQAWAAEHAPASAVRVACAGAVARLMGGKPAQIAAALAMAEADEGPRAARLDALGRGAALGDANSRGVRLALLAMAAADAPAVDAAPRREAAVRERQPGAGGVARALEELAASAGAHFGPRQAALICGRLAHKERLLAAPVNEFAAWLVKNG